MLLFEAGVLDPLAFEAWNAWQPQYANASTAVHARVASSRRHGQALHRAMGDAAVSKALTPRTWQPTHDQTEGKSALPKRPVGVTIYARHETDMLRLKIKQGGCAATRERRIPALRHIKNYDTIITSLCTSLLLPDFSPGRCRYFLDRRSPTMSC
ncbi:MAG: hypothetical protein RIM84_01495 [Alphaproteobacteria bacterium]